MHQLPDLVAAAIKAGLASTKTPSWKVQEGEKALLVQLRWKPVTSVTIGGSLNSKVLSNSNTSGQKQRKNPSRKRRDAIRLKKFILSKHSNSMEPKVVTSHQLGILDKSGAETALNQTLLSLVRLFRVN